MASLSTKRAGSAQPLAILGINYEGGKAIHAARKSSKCLAAFNCQIAMDAPFQAGEEAGEEIRCQGRAEARLGASDEHIAEQLLPVFQQALDVCVKKRGKLLVQVARGRSAEPFWNEVVKPTLDKCMLLEKKKRGQRGQSGSQREESRNEESTSITLVTGYRTTDYPDFDAIGSPFVYLNIGMFGRLSSGVAPGNVYAVASTVVVDPASTTKHPRIKIILNHYGEDDALLVVGLQHCCLLSIPDAFPFVTPELYDQRTIMALFDAAVTGETKEPTTATTALDMDDGGKHDELSLLALQLISHHKRASLLQRILSFHETRNPKDYINLRSSSKLFHRALSQPPPLWTSFPNSNHATLQSLVDHLERLRGDGWSSGNVPTLIFIAAGKYSGKGKYIRVKKPLSIYGAGCGKTTLVGVGLYIKGKKSDGIVEIGDLKIKGGERNGLWADKGMNVIMRGVSVSLCQGNGVLADGADISCNDLQVVGCGGSGVHTYFATITLSGKGTSIQENATNGSSNHYGLKTYYSADKIFVASLTKEQISTNNDGGGNWGGKGTIELIE